MAAQLSVKVRFLSISTLKLYARNPRTHSPKQIRQIADSIQRFGFVNPILVDAEGGVIAGHGRVEAAKLLGMESVPTIRLDRMTEAERRAYIIADNKLAENAGWDRELLALELEYLSEFSLELDLTITGFATAEIDQLLCDASATTDAADEVPAVDELSPTVEPARRLMAAGSPSPAVRRRQTTPLVRTTVRPCTCSDGFHRPALQRPNRRACFGPRRSKASRVCDGLGRDERGGVRCASDERVRQFGQVQL
jgi:ParB-like chromosome segregation protein Spo0J